MTLEAAVDQLNQSISAISERITRLEVQRDAVRAEVAAKLTNSASGWISAFSPRQPLRRRVNSSLHAIAGKDST
jgi:hypothetical protein